MNQTKLNEITIIGFPFTKIGRGIVSLNLFRALKVAGYPPKICDLSSKSRIRDVEIENELNPFLVNYPAGKINIFVINGDQIDSTMALMGNFPHDAYNIIYPAWELSDYPDEWLIKFSIFDEIWAPSDFIKSSFKNKIKIPIQLIPHPINTQISHYINRNYFGIRNNAFTFLFLFDFRSFIERKNPFGMLSAFENLCELNPFMDIQVVIKVSGGERSSKAGNDYLSFLNKIQNKKIQSRVHLIDRILSENEIRNLIRCSDCFVSLHRSEGFGLGLAEAMNLGKPVIGTGYSGNLQFMNNNNSLLVDFKLVPVKPDQYPYSENQFWADPDVNHATYLMDDLVKNQDKGYYIGKNAAIEIQKEFSYLSIGIKIKNRINEIINSSLIT